MVKYSPLKPHIVLLGSYFGNWQRYIRDLGDSFEKVVRSRLPTDASRTLKPALSDCRRRIYR